MRNPGETKGITLIELVVVMALIAMITAIVAPTASGRLKNLTLQTTATEVAARFRKAQSIARLAQTAVVASYSDHQFHFIQGTQEIGTFALPGSISASFQNDLTNIVLLPSGQVTGPEYMQLLNESGRKAVIEFGLVNGITVSQP